MIKEKCVNCIHGSYKGADKVNGNVMFGCMRPLCIFSPIVDNQLHNITIETYKEFNNGKNSRNSKN